MSIHRLSATRFGRRLTIGALMASTVVVMPSIVNAAEPTDDPPAAEEDCEVTLQERVIARRLVDLGTDLLDVARVAPTDPDAAASALSSTWVPGWLDDIIDTASVCGLAMEAVADASAELLEAAAAYLTCVFSGGSCGAEELHMDAVAHDLDVALNNMRFACGGGLAIF